MSVELNWSEVSPEDLKALLDRADQELLSRKSERQQKLLELVEKVKQEAKDLGFDEKILFGVKKERQPLPAKYVHPDDPGKTWSGRGKKPRWLVELEAVNATE